MKDNIVSHQKIPMTTPPASSPSCITLYGISNCDTVKKARQWLTLQGLDYVFHDFKTQGVPAQALDDWLITLGWEALLNRKGTTWRKLEPQTQAAVIDAPSARAVMMAHPSVIKRPVVRWGDQRLTVGFSAERFAHSSNSHLP